MGSFTNVYNWISHDVLGGSRTAAAVKHYIAAHVLSSAPSLARLAQSEDAPDQRTGEGPRKLSWPKCPRTLLSGLRRGRPQRALGIRPERCTAV